jgi:hypothetical protein
MIPLFLNSLNATNLNFLESSHSPSHHATGNNVYCYQTVVPRLVAYVSSRFESSAVFFTDGSKGEAGTGVGVYQLNGGEISFRLQEPSGAFTFFIQILSHAN